MSQEEDGVLIVQIHRISDYANKEVKQHWEVQNFIKKK